MTESEVHDDIDAILALWHDCCHKYLLVPLVGIAKPVKSERPQQYLLSLPHASTADMMLVMRHALEAFEAGDINEVEYNPKGK